MLITFRLVASACFILVISATRWFWTGVDTPVGILILLAVFPPTVFIESYLAFMRKRGYNVKGVGIDKNR